MSKRNIVDIDLGLSLFSSDRKKAIKLFMEYMQELNDDQCLDDKVKIRIPDSEVREHLQKLGITTSSILQHMEKEKRDATLARLKKLNGVTVRQLSRITGISKSVIDRVC
jgi:putative transposase